MASPPQRRTHTGRYYPRGVRPMPRCPPSADLDRPDSPALAQTPSPPSSVGPIRARPRPPTASICSSTRCSMPFVGDGVRCFYCDEPVSALPELPSHVLGDLIVQALVRRLVPAMFENAVSVRTERTLEAAKRCCETVQRALVESEVWSCVDCGFHDWRRRTGGVYTGSRQTSECSRCRRPHRKRVGYHEARGTGAFFCPNCAKLHFFEACDPSEVTRVPCCQRPLKPLALLNRHDVAELQRAYDDLLAGRAHEKS